MRAKRFSEHLLHTPTKKLTDTDTATATDTIQAQLNGRTGRQQQQQRLLLFTKISAQAEMRHQGGSKAGCEPRS